MENPINQLYINTYKKVDFGKKYFQISCKPITNLGKSFLSIFTRWIRTERDCEIREIDSVNPSITMKHFNEMALEIGLIDNEEELTLLLNIGGHALVNETVLINSWKELLLPKQTFMGVNNLYIDYLSFVKNDGLLKSYDKRFAKNKLRISVLERDNFSCRICGASPEENIHVQLELHHIKPWNEGGKTLPENLITLCKVCHQGISEIDRSKLLKKIGITFPLVEHELFLENTSNKEGYNILKHHLSNSLILKVDMPKTTPLATI